MTPQQFTEMLDTAVRQALPDLPEAGRQLLVAHGAYESGWGRCNAFTRGRNFGNITAGSQWTGAKWTDPGGDTDGKGNKITQTWRAYPDLQSAVQDYWSFLGPQQNGGRYVKARLELEGEARPGIFAAYLGKAGYFALNPVTYAQTLSKVLQDVKQFLSNK